MHFVKSRNWIRSIAATMFGLLIGSAAQAATITAADSTAFTNALTTAALGDTIVLNAGTNYTGSFVLPNKTTGSGYITIQSSQLASLPAAGTRVFPANAGNMPKIFASPGSPAIRTATSAHHFKLIGLEIISPADNSFIYNLIELGTSGTAQDTLAEVPNNLILDRCIIRTNSATQGTRRGIALNSASTDILSCYIAGFKEVGNDSQAVAGWNGPGPYNIINNYLEGACENVIFGGSDPSIANLVPSDISFRQNHLFKPLSWKIGHPTYAGTPWSVKNIFELKNARRVTVDGNIFEHNWAHAQTGCAILFTVRNQDGSAPWSVVEDVNFTNNILRRTGSAFNTLGIDDNHPSQMAKRIKVENNLIYEVDSSVWGGSGFLFQMLSQTADITINHNTAFHTGTVVSADGGPHNTFVYTNNLHAHNTYGIFGSNVGSGNGALNTYFPGVTFNKNILMGGSSSLYSQYPGQWSPATLAFPSSWSGVLVNQASPGSNFAGWKVVTGSAYDNTGTDGKDIGCDIDVVNAATAGCISGVWSGQQTVVAPSFSPAPGTYSSAQNVTITTTTSGASIRYTTNGTNPTSTSGTLYTGPVSIASSLTLKAIAYKSGMTDSSVTTGVYTIGGGGGTTTVVLKNGVNGYTGNTSFEVHGDAPTSHFGSSAYHHIATNFAGTSVWVYRPFYKFDVSAGASGIPANAVITSATLKLKVELSVNGADVLSVHRMAPVGGAFSVNYVTATRNTYNGSNAWTGGANAGGDVANSNNDFLDTADASGTVPANGQFINFNVTPSVQAWVNGTANNGWVILSSSAGVRMGTPADLHGSADFPELSVTYQTSTQVAAPTFSPAPGTYSSAQNVTISTTTSGASIRYTTNGTTPTSTTGTLYTGPVSIPSSLTLKAIAYKSGMTDSTVTTGAYTINVSVTKVLKNGVNGYTGNTSFEVHGDAPTTHFGSSAYHHIATNFAGTSVWVYRPFFKFDVSTAATGIPANAVIESATLKFKVELSVDGTDVLSVYRMAPVGGAFTVNYVTATRNTYNGTNGWTGGANAAGDVANSNNDYIDTPVASGTVPANGQYITFNVTSSVQAWVNGTANNGWLILSSSPGVRLGTPADLHGSADYPELTIIYH